MYSFPKLKQEQHGCRERNCGHYVKISVSLSVCLESATSYYIIAEVIEVDKLEGLFFSFSHCLPSLK